MVSVPTLLSCCSDFVRKRKPGFAIIVYFDIISFVLKLSVHTIDKLQITPTGFLIFKIPPSSTVDISVQPALAIEPRIPAALQNRDCIGISCENLDIWQAFAFYTSSHLFTTAYTAYTVERMQLPRTT